MNILFLRLLEGLFIESKNTDKPIFIDNTKFNYNQSYNNVSDFLASSLT
jgi:hypothetical protein